MATPSVVVSRIATEPGPSCSGETPTGWARVASSVPTHLECDACGTAHAIPERPFEPGAGTSCPNCGERPYTVRYDGLEWHPDP